jgi:hypothetical protein
MNFERDAEPLEAGSMDEDRVDVVMICLHIRVIFVLFVGRGEYGQKFDP